MTMEIFYSLWFWIGSIAALAIIAGTISGAVDKSNKTKRYLAELQSDGNFKKVADDAAALNAQVVAKLDAVEGRLAAIEKTLTDIP